MKVYKAILFLVIFILTACSPDSLSSPTISPAPLFQPEKPNSTDTQASQDITLPEPTVKDIPEPTKTKEPTTEPLEEIVPNPTKVYVYFNETRARNWVALTQDNYFMRRMCDDINGLMDKHKKSDTDELPDDSEYADAIKIEFYGIMGSYNTEEERELFNLQGEYFLKMNEVGEDWRYGKISYPEAKAQLNESCSKLDELYKELTGLLEQEGISIKEIEQVFRDYVELIKLEIQSHEE